MKIIRTGLWLSAALIGFFAACRHDDPTPAVPDGYIELKAGTTVPVVDGISVITDTAGVSYCPKNYNCLIAGRTYASVRLVKTQLIQRVRLFNIHSGRVYRPNELNRTDSTNVELARQAYKVILKDQYVGEKDGDYQGRALLMVSRL
jgi:hypothetical protein